MRLETSVGEDIEQLELSYVAGGNAKGDHNFGEKTLIKLKMHLPYDSAIPLPDFYLRDSAEL